MTVSHNLTAMNAQRQFNIVGKKKAKSTEKLSSGYKINRAADDAAGLAISEKMRRQIRGLTQGIENTQDGISMCQVADGALNEVNDMLHRITELSVKSANGTNTAQDRQYIQQEVQQLLTEIDRISEDTEFNEIPIFRNGSINAADGTQGTTAIDTRKPWELSDDEIINMFMNESYATVENDVYLSDIDKMYSKDKANELLDRLCNWMLLDEINRFDFDTNSEAIEPLFWQLHNRYSSDYLPAHSQEYEKAAELAQKGFDEKDKSQFAVRDGNKYGTENRGARKYYDITPMGVDVMEYLSTYIGTGLAMAATKSTAIKNSVLDGTSGELYDMYHQMYAGYGEYTYSAIIEDNKRHTACDIYRYLFKNETGQEETSTDDSETTEEEEKRGWWIQSGAEPHTGMTLEIDEMNTSILGINGLNVSTVSGANHAIDAVKGALTKVMENRSKIGAQQNRLEHTIANESNIVENTTAAESAIRDTDMAKEMVQSSMLDILQQAGLSIMSQANQSNEGVLSLL